MDEEDGQVMPLEEEAEKRAREEAIDNYKMDKELAAMKNTDDWDKGPRSYWPRFGGRAPLTKVLGDSESEFLTTDT